MKQMIFFHDISRLHSFAGLHQKAGRHPSEADLSTVANGAILVGKTGLVEWVGAESDWPTFAKKKPAAWRRRIKKISLKNAEVLPAFTECHTHLLYAGSRAEEFEKRNRGDSYLSIAEAGGGIRSTVRATVSAKTNDLEKALIERLQSLLSQGVTTVEIKTGYAATIEEEKRHLEVLFKLQHLAETGGRVRKIGPLPRIVVTCLAAHSIPDGETETTWLKKVETLLPLIRQRGARLDIFIEKGAFSKKGGQALLEKAQVSEIPVVIHADQLSSSGGTELGVKLKALSVDHVIEVGGSEISQLAKSKTVAVLLPAADVYARLPFPKARAMIDAGVRVALATDHNPGTSPGLDIALVGMLARTMMQMTLPEVFAAYTVNAAAALGLGTKQGSLSRGQRADFIVLKSRRGLADLFYEVGPDRSHAAIAQVWRGGTRLI